MLSLQEQRKQALNLFLKFADKERINEVDYELDKYLRTKLDLPDRPEENKPYIGWLVGSKKKSSNPKRISFTGKALIKRWEGCRLKAYKCSASVWTIGWGHTKDVRPNDKITREQAEMLFDEDIKVFEQAVSRLVLVPLNQNQFDALVSFCYNVGETQFRNSTLLELLNLGEYQQASKQLFRWVRAGGRKLLGLKNRRKEEYKLFNS